MQNLEMIQQFFNAAYEWVCDGYSISIRYIILKDNIGRKWLTSLLIDVSPLAADLSLEFSIDGHLIMAGQIQLVDSSWSEASTILSTALNGRIEVGGETFSMRLPDLQMESDMRQLDRAQCNLHMRAFADESYDGELYDFPSIDAELRQNDLPFDGLQDLAFWLSVNDPAKNPMCEAKLVVHPPVELVWESSSLRNDVLSLSFVAHKNLDKSGVSVAIRALPGERLKGRRQIGDGIEWTSEDEIMKGKLTCEINQADNIMVMICSGGSTVRRHFIIDPDRARNSRYLAIRQFDTNLEKLKRNLFNEKYKNFFEEAINSLLFMLGYGATRLMTTEGPDLIATTADGQYVIIECTKAIADFSVKLGKLVGRRNTLEKAFLDGGQQRSVKAVLVTAQAAAQVASKKDELINFNVALVTLEDLERIVAGLADETRFNHTFDSHDGDVGDMK